VSARPESIGPTLTPSAARARRSVEQWVEQGGQLRGVALDVVQEVAAREAERLRRDLSPLEVGRVCGALVAAEEQRQAEEAIAGAREVERLEYLARVRARLLLMRDSSPRGPR
jgi:hypothetical protein